MSVFSSRWRGPLLIASVGVNLFLAGTFVPHLLRHHEVGPERGPAPGLNYRPRPLSDILPPADAELLQKAMAPDRADFQALEKQARESWAEIQPLLAAEPFDTQAFAAALRKVADSRRAFEASRQSALVDALSRMSPEGRKKLSEMKAPFILGGMHGPRPDGRGPDGRGPDGHGPDGRGPGGPGWPDGRFDHPPFPDGPPPPPDEGSDGPGPAGSPAANPAATPHNDGGIPLTPRAPTATPVTPH
ncbi:MULTISPECIES: periplasmic heavy metal sensor [Nitrospirillum]|uniref:Putative membrane protein n=1 Tax=Nitrospirillum amazonense TaxID=28077 RepID=A0A560FQM9_9PROT|nr:periplasmic heavy metal sensor [Nitrospirillum amazonense]MEC4592896.1 periplasmic heavy metal sensor [Nitrospirillum amazonense]TWB23908.1 putative membrane protein [Nitrospirillum amazonense]